MKRFIPAILCIFLATTAIASDWYEVDESPIAHLFVDTDSISHKTYQGREVIGVWTNMELKSNNKAMMTKGKYVKTSKNYIYIDCKSKMATGTTQIALYAANGDFLGSESSSSKPLENIIPDSIQESAYQYTCMAAMMKEISKYGDDITSEEAHAVSERYPEAWKELLKYNEEKDNPPK